VQQADAIQASAVKRAEQKRSNTRHTQQGAEQKHWEDDKLGADESKFLNVRVEARPVVAAASHERRAAKGRKKRKKTATKNTTGEGFKRKGGK